MRPACHWVLSRLWRGMGFQSPLSEPDASGGRLWGRRAVCQDCREVEQLWRHGDRYAGHAAAPSSTFTTTALSRIDRGPIHHHRRLGCPRQGLARRIAGAGHLEQLAETPEPNCPPHGRFAIVQISKLPLEQEFRRHKQRRPVSFRAPDGPNPPTEPPGRPPAAFPKKLGAHRGYFRPLPQVRPVERPPSNLMTPGRGATTRPTVKLASG